MTDIYRNRTIRPSSRLETSKSYKIDTKQVTGNDTLIVSINHESNLFAKEYRFKGSDVAQKDSISFRVTEFGTSITISWSGAKPIESGSVVNPIKQDAYTRQRQVERSKPDSKNYSTDLKQSFAPISDINTKILVLGTMPGDRSIELGEYYGHPRNRFWKIISSITGNRLPVNYNEKRDLLLKSGIGVWDVAHKANRKGSLDIAIVDEEPNDLDTFIGTHKNLKVIAFNGTKAEALFDKYFSRRQDIQYISLPSTSPANTGINFEMLFKTWQKILVMSK